jgi:hypothetical protein
LLWIITASRKIRTREAVTRPGPDDVHDGQWWMDRTRYEHTIAFIIKQVSSGRLCFVDLFAAFVPSFF